MCDLLDPCKEDEMCDLTRAKCVPLDVPEDQSVLRIKYQDRYFVGSERVINQLLARLFSELMEVPCSVGPQGLLSDDLGELERSGDVISFIDLETKEILCDFSSELFDYWLQEIEESKEVNFPYWPEKKIRTKSARMVIESPHHIFVLVPTQYDVYHVVPVGSWRGEANIEKLDWPFGFSEDLEKLVYEFRGIELEGKEEVVGLSFNSTGRKLAVTSRHRITVWDLRTETPVISKKPNSHYLRVSNARYDWAEFSPVDPDFLLIKTITGTNIYWERLILWLIDVDTTYPIQVAGGEKFNHLRAKFSHDGDSIYYSYGLDASDYIIIGKFSLAQNNKTRIFRQISRYLIKDIAISPDLMATILDNGSVDIWDIQRRRARQIAHIQAVRNQRIELSPNGTELMCYSVVSRAGTSSVDIYSIETQELLISLPLPPVHTPKYIVAKYTVSGERIVGVLSWRTTPNSLVCVWSLNPVQIIQLITVNDRIDELATNPTNNRQIAVGGQSGSVTILEI